MRKRTSIISLASLLVMVLFVFLALGSGGDSGVDRGSDSGQATSTSQEEASESSTRYRVMHEDTVNGLKIIVGEIEVWSDKVLVGITVKNESSDKLSFYPDQGSIVIGSMQLESNMFMSEGNASGEIMPGVEKSSVIYFTTPEGEVIPDEKTITLYFGDVFNVDTYSGTKEFTATITLE